MKHPQILGIGTANPPDRLTQEQSFHAAGYQGERIRKIFLNSDIDHRHFYLEDALAVWAGYIALFGIADETGVVMVVYLHQALNRRKWAAAQARRHRGSRDRGRSATPPTKVNDGLRCPR